MHYSDTNMIYSMIIATAISGVIGWLTGNIPRLVQNLIYYVKRIYRYFFVDAENKINVVGTIFKNIYGIKTNFSPEYNAIMSMIVKNKFNGASTNVINGFGGLNGCGTHLQTNIIWDTWRW